MSDLRFCTKCQRNVVAELKINWAVFIILIILGVVLGLVYLVYCFASSEHRKCPYCGSFGTDLEPPRTNPPNP